MNKTLTALAAAATIAVTAIAVPQEANAYWRGRGGGAVIGGLAAGALIGGALAGGYGYYGGYRPYYGGYGPSYAGYDYGPYAYGACFRERVMTPWGWRWRRI